MSQYSQHVVLNYIDTPLKILFFTVPEMMGVIGPAIIGLAIDHFGLGFLGSLSFIFVYRSYKRHFGRGQFAAVKYWFLPLDARLRTLPPSYIREYLG
jgi:type IV conjugative transfer system protein TraL